MTTTAVETPLHLTSGDRPLYAVLHAPGRPRPGAPAVIHCHAFGVEHMVTYRAEVRMARAAAAAGFPVLRFHARGHGDSAGDFADVTVDTFAEDALAAAAVARARSGSTGVVWLGLRLGALVAAEVLRRDGGAAGLVLWEPVHRAADWARALLRDLLFSQVAHGQRAEGGIDALLERLDREGRVDVQGYYLHRRVVREGSDEDLAARLAGHAPRVLLVQIQPRARLAPAHAALVETLAGAGARVDTALVQEQVGWSFNPNPPWLGDAAIARTVEWLDALA
jgi:alpha/beta superfamily hydrolase